MSNGGYTRIDCNSYKNKCLIQASKWLNSKFPTTLQPALNFEFSSIRFYLGSNFTNHIPNYGFLMPPTRGKSD